MIRNKFRKIEHIKKYYDKYYKSLCDAGYYDDKMITRIQNIFEKVNNNFIDDDLKNTFISKVNSIVKSYLNEELDKDTKKIDILDRILILYYYYDLYGKNIFLINDFDYKVCESAFMEATHMNDIETFNHVADVVVLNNDLFKQLKKNNDIIYLSHLCISIVDDYLSCKKEYSINDIVSKYYIKDKEAFSYIDQDEQLKIK